MQARSFLVGLRYPTVWRLAMAQMSLALLAWCISAVSAQNRSEPDLNALLTRLEKIAGAKIQPISAEELALFADARDGKLDDVSFAEAALLASGVTDAAKRRKYLERIDTLEVEARRATATVKTPSEKGQLLLKWMHGGPLKPKGYKILDSDLGTVLDRGTFNCLSSVVLYHVIGGRRLGLPLGAVENPGTRGHVWAVIHDS